MWKTLVSWSRPQNKLVANLFHPDINEFHEKVLNDIENHINNMFNDLKQNTGLNPALSARQVTELVETENFDYITGYKIFLEAWCETVQDHIRKQIDFPIKIYPLEFKFLESKIHQSITDFLVYVGGLQLLELWHRVHPFLLSKVISEELDKTVNPLSYRSDWRRWGKVNSWTEEELGFLLLASICRDEKGVWKETHIAKADMFTAFENSRFDDITRAARSVWASQVDAIERQVATIVYPARYRETVMKALEWSKAKRNP